jgi:hypothetical protein
MLTPQPPLDMAARDPTTASMSVDAAGSGPA